MPLVRSSVACHGSPVGRLTSPLGICRTARVGRKAEHTEIFQAAVGTRHNLSNMLEQI